MSGPPVGTSVEDVVATVAHAGLERMLELRLGAEALVGPAAEPSGRAPDRRASARRSARGPDRRAGRRAEQPTNRPSDRRLPGGASRGVESQFAALGLVAGDPGGVIVGIHRRLVAPYRGAAGDDDGDGEHPSTHVHAAPLSRSPDSSRSPPPPGAQHLLLHASTTDLMPRAGRGSDTKADDRDASSDD